MSKNHCSNNYYNTCDNYNNGVSNGANSFPYILIILLLFGGGGSKPGSFWSNYNDIFLCSGFNNGWCSNTKSNNNFNNNNLPNNNFTGFLSNFSNNNTDINKITDSYI